MGISCTFIEADKSKDIDNKPSLSCDWFRGHGYTGAVCEIDFLYVEEFERGQGKGSRLVQGVFDKTECDTLVCVISGVISDADDADEETTLKILDGLDSFYTGLGFVVVDDAGFEDGTLYVWGDNKAGKEFLRRLQASKDANSSTVGAVKF